MKKSQESTGKHVKLTCKHVNCQWKTLSMTKYFGNLLSFRARLIHKKNPKKQNLKSTIIFVNNWLH